jgi:hypothetical protein
MRKLWRVRVTAALVVIALSVWVGAFGGSIWLEVVGLVLLGLIILPFWSSDRRVEAEWKARQDASSRRPRSSSARSRIDSGRRIGESWG